MNTPKNTMEKAASAAALMLVTSVIERRVEKRRNSATFGGQWLVGLADGKLACAKFICRSFPAKIIAKEIRKWVEFHKKRGELN